MRAIQGIGQERIWRWVTTDQLVSYCRVLARNLPWPLKGVVGLPRGGMISASLISSWLNLPLYAITDKLVLLPSSGRRLDESRFTGPLLLIDDDAFSGLTLKSASEILFDQTKEPVITAAAIAWTGCFHPPDYTVWEYSTTWLAEWRFFSAGNWAEKRTAYDFDGVLCEDCPVEDDDDGPRYAAFLENTKPLYFPRPRPIPLIVTARTEKWRPQTEAWMRRYGLTCTELVMRQPGPWNRAEIVRLKADTWLSHPELTFFVESDYHQASDIAKLVKRPVICPTYVESPYRGISDAPCIFNPHLLTEPAEKPQERPCMRPECQKFAGRVRELCEGTADLPLSKINAYRKRFGLGPLSEAEVPDLPRVPHFRPTPSDPPVKKSTPTTKQGCCGGGQTVTLTPKEMKLAQVLNGRGVGSKLWHLLARLGIQHTDDCACIDLALRMNRLGPAGCRREKEKLLVQMRENQEAYGWRDWLTAAAKSVTTGIILHINPLDPLPGLLEEAIQQASQSLSPSRNITWSYGVTTVPARVSTTLPKTLSSLQEAGFTDPRVFVDGDTSELDYRDKVTQREHIRLYGNFILGLLELYVREPKADRYAMFQDDILACRNLREYLEHCELPPKVYWNLYTFPQNEDQDTGWHPSNQLGKGALGLVFDREGLLALLSSRTFLNRPQDPHRGHQAIDGGVVTALGKLGYNEYVHSPSLLQHVGHDSTMGHRNPRARTFKGEGFDALRLLE